MASGVDGGGVPLSFAEVFARANVVPAKTCQDCVCTDHEPPPALPRTLPCVHLGDYAGKRVSAHDVFTCVAHGLCMPDGVEKKLSDKVRACAQCDDYLSRDPFGPNSAQMAQRVEAFLAELAEYPTHGYEGRGVVIAGGGDKYFASLYVTIRALRHVGCQLPIQVWYLDRKKEMPPDKQALFAPGMSSASMRTKSAVSTRHADSTVGSSRLSRYYIAPSRRSCFSMPTATPAVIRSFFLN